MLYGPLDPTLCALLLIQHSCTYCPDPTPADDHVQHVSSTNTSIVLQAPPISCIDENGHISEFRLRYAQTEDFGRGENVRNGIFSPGLVIVGNLEPGTRYTFQLRILTQQGGSVILDPLTTSTTGGCGRWGWCGEYYGYSFCYEYLYINHNAVVPRVNNGRESIQLCLTL